MRWLILLAAAAVLAGCGSIDAGGTAQSRVVATTPVAADLVRAVAGEQAKVTSMVPANADPHEYEPRPRDIAALADADIIVRSGGDLDAWLEDAITASGTTAHELSLIDHVGGTVGGDPHWWHDPDKVRSAIEAIRDELIDIDLEPAGEPAYIAGARSYLARLRTLTAGIERCVATVPKSRRKLVTSHDALGYYARRFGLEVIGTVIPSLSTQSQASAGETAALVKTIRAAKVRVIFAESLVNPKVEAAIAREAGATVGAPLFADGLGPAGTEGATYLGALATNTRRIVNGMGGTCEVRA
jgi:ABC-type Zn uptake system ZnuABC Zn-binding protein ZnuA